MSWAEVWRRRSALMYTVGAWSVFGYIIYRSSSYIAERTEDGQQAPQEARPAGNKMGSTRTVSEDGLRETEVYTTPGASISVVSTTVYKPNFVPYTTRLYNYVQLFFDDSGGKEK